jgi:hypothetical protein
VRDGQTRALLSLGFRALPGTSVISSERYADEISLLAARAREPAPRFGARVERILPAIREMLATKAAGRGGPCARWNKGLAPLNHPPPAVQVTLSHEP